MSEKQLTFDEAHAEIMRRTPTGIQPDLSRVTEVLDLLGNPQRAYPSIHVTGTNGKTSTVRMIDALLRAHDLRTGRFTSPHLTSLTERITFGGDSISEERFAEVYADVAPMVELIDAKRTAAGEPTVTYFEFVTVLAFAAFADAPIDVGVIEVGLGGRWDATNVVSAPVAVFTPIDLDHTRLLGNSVAEIATEKAGIIHENATVITAVQSDEAALPLVRRSVEVGAAIARQGSEFGVLEREVAVGGQLVKLQGLGAIYDEIFLPLHGAHQAQNAAVALAAVEAFFGAGIRDGKPHALDPETVRRGFGMADSPGRLERVRTSPPVLVDAAHNPAGLGVTLRGVAEAFGFRRLVVVLAVLGDKDVRSMVELLEPATDEIVVTTNSSPRAMDPDALGAIAVEVFGPDRVEVAPRMDDAIEAAVRLAEESLSDGPLGGVGVLVTGSVVTAAEARQLFVK